MNYENVDVNHNRTKHKIKILNAFYSISFYLTQKFIQKYLIKKPFLHLNHFQYLYEFGWHTKGGIIGITQPVNKNKIKKLKNLIYKF